ncbi:hypothetical protein LTR66_003424 [Elasticomyces elasticus]|nr:hypothetical protein LTR66_003424 [Elasticomyces elasticus]
MGHTSGDSMTSDSNAISPTQPTASYQSASTSKAFPNTRLGTVPSEQSAAQGNTLYLSSLRANVSQLQNDINAFMTQQTEDDRARGAAAAMGVAQKHRKSERGREKEKRGEENMEEDARALLEAGSLRTGHISQD